MNRSDYYELRREYRCKLRALEQSVSFDYESEAWDLGYNQIWKETSRLITSSRPNSKFWLESMKPHIGQANYEWRTRCVISPNSYPHKTKNP